jgi:hypothetical protein
MQRRLHRFWRFWFIKTENERKYINILEEFYKDFIQNNKHDIMSVYVGGSWQRRESHAKSDCDVYIIICDKAKISIMSQKVINFRIKVKPLDFSPHVYCLKELATEKFEEPYGWQVNRTTYPTFILANLSEYSLMYGSRLDSNVLRIPKDDELLKLEIRQLKYTLGDNIKFPQETYNRDKLRAVCKWLFYMVHYETRLKLDKQFPFHRKELVRRFRRENEHIIHLCNEARKDPIKYLDKADEIYERAEKYLEFVEKNYFNPQNLQDYTTTQETENKLKNKENETKKKKLISEIISDLDRLNKDLNKKNIQIFDFKTILEKTIKDLNKLIDEYYRVLTKKQAEEIPDNIKFLKNLKDKRSGEIDDIFKKNPQFIENLKEMIQEIY